MFHRQWKQNCEWHVPISPRFFCTAWNGSYPCEIHEPWRAAEVWMIYTSFSPSLPLMYELRAPSEFVFAIKNSVSYLSVNNWAQGHAAASRNVPWFHVQGSSYPHLTKIIFYSHTSSHLSSSLILCSGGFLFGNKCLSSNWNISKQNIIFCAPFIFYKSSQITSLEQ